jgi:anti-sigma28 factor (negative regulator of flagellin synthesis)
MDADRERKMTYIKEEVERGSYQVDPKAVADAILRMLRERAVAAVSAPAQNECS